MNGRRPCVSVLLGLGMAAASHWLLSPGHWSSVAAPTAAPRYVATTGTDTANDCASQGTPCRTVQHAVDAASAGDLIKVAAGTYTDIHQRDSVSQVVYITKSVTLQGGYTTADGFAEPPEPVVHLTTLDAQGQGRVVVIDRASATVDGFTITGGAGYYSGGGIYVTGREPVILRHNRIVENSAEGDGGAIFVKRGSVQILDNRIVENASTWSAGLRIINDSDAVVVGNSIRHNVAQATGGGIDVDCCGGTTPFIARNTIVNNEAGAGGGGLRVSSTNARLVNNVLAGNQGRYGDGILLEGSASFPVSVTLVHNTLVGQGTGGEGVHAAPYVTARVVNNIVTGFTVGVTNTSSVSSAVTANHTLFDSNGTDFGPGVGSTNQVSGPAAFIAPHVGDYHITAASAAVDAGTPTGVTVDIDGEARSGLPDLGADEYSPRPAPRLIYLPRVSLSAEVANH